MTENSVKTGTEILDEYFRRLAEDQEIDANLRQMLKDLWEQKRLSTTTHLTRELDKLIENKSK